MAASKGNYLVVYRKISQVYAATTLETAVKTPLPKGCAIEDKCILYLTYEPDNEALCVYEIPQDEIDLVLEKMNKQKELQELQDAVANQEAERDSDEQDEEDD